MANGTPHRQAFVVGLLVDRYALLPGFEAGRGAAAIALVWYMGDGLA